MSEVVLSGFVGSVGMSKKRRFFQVTKKFGDIRNSLERRLYNGKTGKGEQRALVPANVSRLSRAVTRDEYTPTSWSLSLTKKQLSEAIFDEHGNITVKVSEDDKIPIIDGGHRDATYEKLCSAFAEAEEENDREKAKLIESQDVPLIVYIDGCDPKEDFINLNNGRPVDKSHMLSLQIRKGQFEGTKDEHSLKMALETAKIMSSDKPARSWLTNYILFDSRKELAPKLAMPINTVMGRGSSDIACSMVGGARIALAFDRDAEWLATQYRTVYNIILENNPDMFKPGQLLTPPPDGTKAGATFLIAIGNCLAYYLGKHDKESLDEKEVDMLMKSVEGTLDTTAKGNTSADQKRSFIGAFAADFFEQYNQTETEPIHEDVPLGLVDILSAATFGLSKLPKKVGAE